MKKLKDFLIDNKERLKYLSIFLELAISSLSLSIIVLSIFRVLIITQVEYLLIIFAAFIVTFLLRALIHFAKASSIDNNDRSNKAKKKKIMPFIYLLLSIFLLSMVLLSIFFKPMGMVTLYVGAIGALAALVINLYLSIKHAGNYQQSHLNNGIALIHSFINPQSKQQDTALGMLLTSKKWKSVYFTATFVVMFLFSCVKIASMFWHFDSISQYIAAILTCISICIAFIMFYVTYKSNKSKSIAANNLNCVLNTCQATSYGITSYSKKEVHAQSQENGQENSQILLTQKGQ